MARGKTPDMFAKQAENNMFSLDKALEQANRSRARHKRLNLALFSSHFIVVASILAVLAVGYNPPVPAGNQSSRAVSVLDQNAVPSVDQIVAASVANDVARLAELPLAPSVESLYLSMATKSELAQVDDNFFSKPQIVTEDSARPAISSYTAVAGDTVQSIAAKFSVSEDTIRWANNLSTDALSAGRELTIPGTTGVVYTVKAGDTIDGLANRYKADRDRIVTYNNLELSGLVNGAKIVIPEGILPENERPGYRAPASYGFSTSLVSRAKVYAGNRYAYGNCTWYAYNRRAELGRPVGSLWSHARLWDDNAIAAGYRVDRSPEPGAVYQTDGYTGFGHVGVVERVNEDGSIVVSEMNYYGSPGGGFGRVSSRTIPAHEVGIYKYIH